MTFEEAVEPLRRDFVLAISQEPKDAEGVTLIHQYTRLRTVVDVLTAFPDIVPREVWATSAPHMNDTEEFEHARKLFKAALLALKADSANADQLATLEILEREVELANGRPVFCACYSAKGDDLNQWRGYADGGRGVCLSFDLEAMRQAFPAYTGWVIYDPAKQKDFVKRILEDLAKAFDHALIGEQLSETQEAAHNALSLFLPLVFTFLKHPKFSEEVEFRIAYLRDLDEGPVPLAFRVDGTRVQPYVKLSVRREDAFVALPLRRVTLSPGSRGENNLGALHGLLEECGLDKIEARESEIPFLPTN